MRKTAVWDGGLSMNMLGINPSGWMSAETPVNTQSLNYIVLLHVFSRSHFLLWQSGGSAPDQYALQPGTSSFLMAKTVEELLDKAASL